MQLDSDGWKQVEVNNKNSTKVEEIKWMKFV